MIGVGKADSIRTGMTIAYHLAEYFGGVLDRDIFLEETMELVRTGPKEIVQCNNQGFLQGLLNQLLLFTVDLDLKADQCSL